MNLKQVVWTAAVAAAVYFGIDYAKAKRGG